MPSKTHRWQYYLSNSVDGKNLGWKSYDAAATGELEAQWQQQQSDPSKRCPPTPPSLPPSIDPPPYLLWHCTQNNKDTDGREIAGGGHCV